MKFFVPYATDDAQAQQVWQATRAFAHQNTGATTPRKIRCIKYVHRNTDCDACVGERETHVGEDVLVILEAAQMFFICTPNRGVLRGIPILVGKDEVTAVEDFD